MSSPLSKPLAKALLVVAVGGFSWWAYAYLQAVGGVGELLISSQQTLQQQPWWYVIGMALATGVGIPTIIGVLLGGYLYGSALGACLSISAYLLGACISFSLARTLGQGWIERMAAKQAMIANLNLVLERRGVLMVAIVRLALVIPYNILNFALGASSLKMHQYALGTLIGITPIFVVYSAVGAAATSLLDVIQGNAQPDISGGAMLAFGAVMVGVLVLVIRWSSKQLSRELQQQGEVS